MEFSLIHWTKSLLLSKVISSGTAQGVAKLHPDDKYDADIGQRISESRAQEKAFRYVKNYLKRMRKHVERDLDELDGGITRFFKLSLKEQEHIDKLIKD